MGGLGGCTKANRLGAAVRGGARLAYAGRMTISTDVPRGQCRAVEVAVPDPMIAPPPPDNLPTGQCTIVSGDRARRAPQSSLSRLVRCDKRRFRTPGQTREIGLLLVCLTRDRSMEQINRLPTILSRGVEHQHLALDGSCDFPLPHK